MHKSDELALLGGMPVRRHPWPKWPIVHKKTEDYLYQALHSGRWAISGPYLGTECFERKFAKSFADFTGAKYSVPTINGTSALTMALLVLKIQPGDEILVSGLTWVASASSIAALGAIPVLVDIDPETLCMSYESAKNKITNATKAVVLVHLYSSLADIDAFLSLARAHNLAIIEDCAQAHGAHWRGNHVGTLSHIGCFSMQQSKLLTSGEGGAVITNDPHLHSLLEQVRSDGRIFLEPTETEIGRLELKEVGDIQGHNMCMSEFHAAILLAGLDYLQAENEIRHERAEYLNQILSSEGIIVVKSLPQVTQRTYYNYVFRLDLDQFGNNKIDVIGRALSAELKVPINTIYSPLNSHPLYCPLNSSRFMRNKNLHDRVNPKLFSLPHAEKARATCLSFHHSLLLGDKRSMEDILKAIVKLRKNNKNLMQESQIVSRVSF